MQLAIAVGLALVLTLLISPVEIRVRAKGADLADCWGSAFFFYAAILGVGNLVAAVLATPLLDGQLSQTITSQSSLIAPGMSAFAGVFAFEGVLSNTNITVFGKGILTIDDWIEKARTSAIEAAVEKHARAQQFSAINSADVLSKLPNDELNAHLLTVFGSAEKVAEIKLQAEQSGANVKAYQALILANQHPRTAAALVRRAKKKASKR